MKYFRIADRVCQIGILSALFPFVSAYTLALMAIDRVIYLKKPLTYERIVTPRRMFFTIVAAWVFCTAVCALPFFGFGRVGLSHNYAYCIPLMNKRYTVVYLMIMAVLFVLGILVQLFGCGCIIYITRKHIASNLRRLYGSKKERSGPNSGSKVNGNYNKTQIQLVKVFGAIFTASILTYLPVVVFKIVLLIYSDIATSTAFITVGYVSLMSRSVINPIVESYITREIRKALSEFRLTYLCEKMQQSPSP